MTTTNRQAEIVEIQIRFLKRDKSLLRDDTPESIRLLNDILVDLRAGDVGAAVNSTERLMGFLAAVQTPVHRNFHIWAARLLESLA